MAQRIVISRRGGPDVLELVDGATPDPGPGEVRVRSLAIGVSAHDAMLRAHSFPGFPKTPFTPGVDVVGMVESVGDGVTSLHVGERVAALLTGEGGYAEEVCFGAEWAVPVPDGVNPADAVCVVANYVTAYGMLHRGAEVQEGEKVLVQGAAGGVGTALLQLGALAGLEMYGTASPHNHELVRSLGAVPIDYRSEDVVARVRELTDGGVDAVFDPIGGFRQLRRSYRTLRKGGRLIWFGVAASSQRGVVRVIGGSLAARLLLSLVPDGKKAPMPPNTSKPIEWYRASLADLLDLLAAGRISPVIAERFPLADAVRAHEVLERGGHAGKMVLIP